MAGSTIEAANEVCHQLRFLEETAQLHSIGLQLQRGSAPCGSCGRILLWLAANTQQPASHSQEQREDVCHQGY